MGGQPTCAYLTQPATFLKDCCRAASMTEFYPLEQVDVVGRFAPPAHCHLPLPPAGDAHRHYALTGATAPRTTAHYLPHPHWPPTTTPYTPHHTATPLNCTFPYYIPLHAPPLCRMTGRFVDRGWLPRLPELCWRSTGYLTRWWGASLDNLDALISLYPKQAVKPALLHCSSRHGCEQPTT